MALIPLSGETLLISAYSTCAGAFTCSALYANKGRNRWQGGVVGALLFGVQAFVIWSSFLSAAPKLPMQVPMLLLLLSSALTLLILWGRLSILTVNCPLCNGSILANAPFCRHSGAEQRSLTRRRLLRWSRIGIASTLLCAVGVFSGAVGGQVIFTGSPTTIPDVDPLAPTPTPIVLMQVVTALVDIPRGAPFSEQNTALRELPVAAIPVNASRTQVTWLEH